MATRERGMVDTYATIYHMGDKLFLSYYPKHTMFRWHGSHLQIPDNNQHQK